MAAEIVHDDDICRSKGRRELLFDVGAEAFAVYRSIDYAMRGETVATQLIEELSGRDTRGALDRR